MVLVEVRQSVIQVDWGADIVRDGKLQRADWGVFDLDTIRWPGGVQRLSPLWPDRAVGGLEGRGDLAVWDRLEFGGCGGIAVGVVDNQFLHLWAMSARLLQPKHRFH